MADMLQNEGDPVFFQHIVWLFGHPSVWVTIASLIFYVVGAVKFGRVIKRSGQILWFRAYLTVLIAFGMVYVFLLRQSYKALVDGAPNFYAFEGLMWIEIGLAVCAVASLICIVVDLFRRSKV
ncbi:MAG: hypothetical protein AAGI28_01435 [Pseudomonadota bacterium]